MNVASLSGIPATSGQHHLVAILWDYRIGENQFQGLPLLKRWVLLTIGGASGEKSKQQHNTDAARKRAEH
jgi:hypothetical protein